MHPAVDVFIPLLFGKKQALLRGHVEPIFVVLHLAASSVVGVLSIPAVNLSPIIRVDHIDNQLPVIHCVDNAVAANTQPEKPVMPFQGLNVGAVW